MLAGVQSTFNRLNGARGSHLGSQVNSIQMVWSERYTYDANGNIATKTTPYGTIDYTYDKENRLLTRGTVHYTYDEEGNLLEEESKDRYNKRYTYTGFNRIEVSDVLNHTDYTHTITGYRYDSFGRRVLTFEQDKPGMRSIYDGLTFEVLKEAETFLGTGNITSDLSGEANIQNYNPHGSEHTKGERYYWRAPNGGNEQKGKSGAPLTGRTRGVRTYLYLNGERVAVNNLYNSNHGQYYYGSDILGSITLLTGEHGQEIKRIGYDIFGGIYQGYSLLGLETGYTGKPYDAVTGLSDYGFRDYAPSHARFITEDPIRDGENWFAYVGNNPVNFIDPWGLEAGNCSDTKKQYDKLLSYGITFKISGYAKHPGMPNSSGQNLYLHKPQDACFLRCHFEAQTLKEAGFTPNYVLLDFIDKKKFNYHIAPYVKIGQDHYVVDPLYGGKDGVKKLKDWADQFPAHKAKYLLGVKNDNLIPNTKLWQNYNAASTDAQNTQIPEINDFAKKWMDAYGKTGNIAESMYEAIK